MQAAKSIDLDAVRRIMLELRHCCLRQNFALRQEDEQVLLRHIAYWKGQDIAELLYPLLRNTAPTESAGARNLLRSCHYARVAANALLLQETWSLLKAFEQAGVSAVPMKGMAVLPGLYPGNAGRLCRDIDILLAPEQLAQARDILLRDFGYCEDPVESLISLQKDPWQAHVTFVRQAANGARIHLDVHSSLGVPRPRYEVPEAWGSLDVLTWPQGGELRVLSPHYQLLVLVMHQQRLGNHLSLKAALDFALFFERYAARLDWSAMLLWLQSRKALSALWVGLVLSELLGGGIPHPVREKLVRLLGAARCWVTERLVQAALLTDNPWKGRQLFLQHCLVHDQLSTALQQLLPQSPLRLAKLLNRDPADLGNWHKHRLLLSPLIAAKVARAAFKGEDFSRREHAHRQGAILGARPPADT